jgi:hypothetical protein
MRGGPPAPPGPFLLPPPGPLTEGGADRDDYGDDALVQGGMFLIDVFRGNWAGVATDLARCARDEFCRNVLKAVPTGGMPTALVLHGGFGGLLRSSADANRELQLNHR